MLDFNPVEFSKAISLNSQKNIRIETNYELVKLGEVVETIESGNRPKGGVGNIASGVWSLGGEHINATNGMVDLDEPKYVSLDFYQNSPKGLLKENDILLCKDGALTGKIALLRKELNNQEAMVNEHVFILRTSPIEKQKYIFNFLFSKDGQTLLKQNITGSAQGGINMTNLKNIKIPLPPVEMQQKIVDECEAVDNEVEQSRQTITEAKQQVEQKVRTVMNANYEMKKIGEITEVKKGQSITSKETREGNIKVVAGGIDYAYLHDKSNREEKTITISASGANAGYVNFWNEPIFASDCTTVRKSKELITYYIFCVLRFLQNDIFKLARGTAQPHVYPNDIAQIKIPVPPLEIQKKLVAEVEELEETISKAQEILDNSATQKNTILKKYL